MFFSCHYQAVSVSAHVCEKAKLWEHLLSLFVCKSVLEPHIRLSVSVQLYWVLPISSYLPVCTGLRYNLRAFFTATTDLSNSDDDGICLTACDTTAECVLTSS